MRYVLNEPLKTTDKRRMDETKTKLTETTPITPTIICTNKVKHQSKV